MTVAATAVRPAQQRNIIVRLLLRAASILYGLVMFEVVIMLSPFAFYFYSAYGPLLKWLDRSSLTAWLTGFVLPHSVVTNSALLEVMRWKIGRAAFSVGLIGFILCAVQIYGAKLLRRRTVASGVYRYVRHPQYVCLAVTAFGLFTIWPRLIILLLFAGMLFTYYQLAKVEERHMLAVDPVYEDYCHRTAMFIPGNPGGKLYQAMFGRFITLRGAHFIAWAIVILLLLLTALGLRSYSLSHISRVTDATGMDVVSAYPAPISFVREASTLALAEDSVQNILKKEHGATFVAHILPRDYPMIGMFADVGSAHMKSGDISLRSLLELGWWLVPYSQVDSRTDLIGSNQNELRVVFSRVDSPHGMPVSREQIFALSSKMTAVCIVDISVSDHKIENVIIPPRRSFWGNIKMPIF